MLNVVYDWERGIAASAALNTYFTEILAERRRNPQDDLISMLAQSELDGARLTDAEIFAFLLLILPAGVETTYRASGNLLVAMLTQPAPATMQGEAMRRSGATAPLLDALRADRGLLPAAFEEALRWEPPITTVVRQAVRDCELGGVAIAAGTNVSVSVAAANRDPDPLSRPGPLRSHPQAHRAPDVRWRPASVPGHAFGAHGGDGGDQRAAGPAAGSAAGPDGAAAAYRGDGVSVTGGAAGRVHCGARLSACQARSAMATQ